MNIPSLPTDNLYKMMCVGGIILITVSAILAVQLVISDKQYAQEQYLKLWDMHLAGVDIDQLSDPDKVIESIPKDVTEEQKAKLTLLAADYQVRKHLWKTSVNESLLLLAALFFAGVFLAVLGAILWWRCVQSLLDRELKLRVSLQQAELDKIGPNSSNEE